MLLSKATFFLASLYFQHIQIADGATPSCHCGFYCPTGPASSTACPAGHYCPTGSIQPILCPAGAYCLPKACNFSVTPCGYYSEPGMSIPSPCVKGSYCPAGASKPIPCPPGTRCLHGEASSHRRWGAAGQCAPERCPPGYFCPNSTSYISCACGTYCPPGASAYTLCKAGTYCPAKASAPTVCAVGKYCPADGLCRESPCGCTVGYCPLAGTIAPFPCRFEGSTCSATSPVPCNGAQICPGTPTVPDGLTCVSNSPGCGCTCKPGYCCDDPTVAPYKGPCRARTTKIAGVTVPKTTPTPIKPPTAVVHTSTPPPCTGHYYTAAGTRTLCPGRYYCPTPSSAPLPCPAGFYCQPGVCSPAPSICGTYSPPMSLLYHQCPKGTYCPARSSAPKPCPADFYCSIAASKRRWDSPGNCLPKACPVGDVSPPSSISPRDCTKAVAKPVP